MGVPYFSDRVRSESLSTGTSTFSTSASITGYQPYDFAVANDVEVYYCIQHRSATEWEVGVGRMASGNQLVRDRVLASSSGGSKVNFSAGTKDIFFTAPAGLLSNLLQPTHNLLINGGFDYFQRQAPATATARSDDTYGPDRWYVLTQTAAVNCERSTGDTFSRYAVKLTQNQASSQRLGLAQIVENASSKPMRGRNFLARMRIKCSASQAIRLAAVEWTGTADSVTSDIVNSWTNGTFTAGQFFNSTSLTITGTATVTPSAATWTDIELRGTFGSSVNNIIVFVWTEATAAQSVTLEVTEAGLYEGTEPRIWLPRPAAAELLECQRFFEKSRSLDTLMTTAGDDGFVQSKHAAAGSNSMYQSVAMKVAKRATPTITVYDGLGAAGKARQFTTSGGTDGITCSTDNVVQTGFGANVSGVANGVGFGFNWQAEAEL